MVRKLIQMGVFGALGMISMMAAYGAATAADAKDADISTIMKASFGKGGFKTTLPAAVKGEKWDEATKLAKEWAEYGAALGKNKPPKGDAESWKKMSEAFTASTKSILTAAEKKDAKALTKAMAFNCQGCHKGHK